VASESSTPYERRPRSSRTPTIVDRLRARGDGRTPFSVEFYPPRNEAEERRLWRAVRTFEQLNPAFASLTYGAGGSTRDRTIRIAGQMP
jgi:methylenetetrahydrofolate reductase (NADPH)